MAEDHDKLSVRGQIAVALAKRGFRIFPIRPNEKKPAVDRWPEVATTDVSRIVMWWTVDPNFNIGICCGGVDGRYLVVIDYDCAEGKSGGVALRQHQFLAIRCPTMVVKTPHGEHHYYWCERSIANSVGKVAANVDVRGARGYVVGPGSVVAGNGYAEIEGIAEPASLPEALEELAMRASRGPARVYKLPPVGRMDTPQSIERAKEYLVNEAPEAISGQHGNDTTFKVACRVKDIGISPKMCLELMSGWWNDEKAIPPWTDAELVPIIKHAYDYGESPPGAANPDNHFADDIEALKVSGGWVGIGKKERSAGTEYETSEGLRIEWFRARNPRLIPMRDWIYGSHLIRRFASATIAMGGTGKSSLLIAEAVALAVGKPLLGVPVKQRYRVWYFNGEDPIEELERRIVAVCLYYQVNPADLEGWLFVNSGRDKDLIIAAENRDGIIINWPIVKRITEEVQQLKIDVMLIDPFVATHRVSENNNNAIAIVAYRWSRIADTCNIAIGLSHHTRKTGGAEVTVEDSRGASALRDAVRSARALNTMTAEEGAKLQIERYLSYFRLFNGKMNMAPPIERSDWFHITSVNLGNGPAEDNFVGDQVGVVEKFELPNVMDSVSEEDFEKVKLNLRTRDWKADIRAQTNWAGVAVALALGLNWQDPGDKQRIKGLLDGWIKAKLLRVVPKWDAKRSENKLCIEVTED